MTSHDDPSMLTWHVRPYRNRDDVDRVLQLYAAVYGRPLSADYYAWKLLDTPLTLPAPNIWLADSGEQLAGHYAATPLRFKLGDEELTVAHTGDAMTHPAFRRQGVFTRVAQAAHEAWGAAGVPFLVGVPNDQWRSRRAPLGYREQFQLAWFWRPLRPDRLLSRRYRLPPLIRQLAGLSGRLWNGIWEIALRTRGTIHVSDLHQPTTELDDLWQALKGHYPALYVRDRAWLTYRYTQAPGQPYRLLLARRETLPAGYLAYRLTGSGSGLTSWIADLFTAPQDEEARAVLLRAALRAMTAAGAGSARILLAPGLPLARTLRRAGFWRARGTFDACLVALQQPLPDLSSPHDWFTMAGDYDII